MKKLFAVLILVAIMCSIAPMSVFAQEATLTADDNVYYGEVGYTTTGYNPDEATTWNDPNTNVSVNVTWTDTTFTYDFGNKWDPKTHEYVNQPGWNKDYIDVTVTNHSNCPVAAAAYVTNIHTPNTHVYFVDNRDYAELTSAVNARDVAAGNNAATFTMKFDYTPKTYVIDSEYLFDFAVEIMGITFTETEPETPDTPDEPTDGEHVHHYVYDQFGRLVCTGCNEVKHEYCIDEDEDGLCDECGLERDFCPDCHIGGTCRCI